MRIKKSQEFPGFVSCIRNIRVSVAVVAILTKRKSKRRDECGMKTRASSVGNSKVGHLSGGVATESVEEKKLQIHPD